MCVCVRACVSVHACVCACECACECACVYADMDMHSACKYSNTHMSMLQFHIFTRHLDFPSKLDIDMCIAQEYVLSPQYRPVPPPQVCVCIRVHVSTHTLLMVCVLDIPSMRQANFLWCDTNFTPSPRVQYKLYTQPWSIIQTSHPALEYNTNFTPSPGVQFKLYTQPWSTIKTLHLALEYNRSK